MCLADESASGSGDITGVTTAVNSGLSGGADTGQVSLSLDLNGLTPGDVSVANDSIAIIDSDGGGSKRNQLLI